MARYTAILAAALFLGAACAAGSSAQQTPPSTRPSGQAGAVPKLTGESSINEILKALDEAGADLQSLEATVLLTEIDNDTGTPTARPGKVLLARQGKDVLFRATFTGVIVKRDDRDGLRPEKIEYLLREGELIDRNYQTRTQTIQKLPPEERDRDLLKLGEGPFPLPIGQSPEEVLAQFEVTEVDPADETQNEMGIDATADTRRLRLTPKEGTELAKTFRWLEIDVNLQDGMPAKVITLNPTGSTGQVTELRNVKRNTTLPPDAFELEPIDRNQWNVVYNDLSKPQD